MNNWININASPQDGVTTGGDRAAGLFNGKWGTAPKDAATTFITADQHDEGFDNMLNTKSNGTTPLREMNSGN